MSVSKARRAELQDELLGTMRKLDALKVELHEAQAENREQAKLHQKKLAELRDILEGREGDQVLLPGTEAGTVKPPKPTPPRPPEAKVTAPTARQTASGITWTADEDESWTGRSRSQARVYRVSAVRVTATGKLNWSWHLPGSALHHGGSSGYDTNTQAMAAAERHELHYWPKKPKKAAPVSPARPKGEIVRWVADERARKVPNFVIEMTGLKTKAGVIAKYGERAVFEKAKPLPKPAPPKAQPDPKPKDGVNTCRGCGKTRHRPGGALTTGGHCWSCHTKRSSEQGKGAQAKPKKKGETCARCRIEDAETTIEGQRVCFSCSYKVQDEAEAARKSKAKPEPKFEATAPRHISWTEGDGTLQVVAGTTTYRVQEITPTRWVLESKSERERSWHKEAVLESLNACESEVMKRHPATTFAEVCLHCGIPADQPSEGCTECQHGDPLDDLVGSREDAVKRHKEVAGG